MEKKVNKINIKTHRNNPVNVFSDNDASFYINNVNGTPYHKFKLICKFVNINDLNKYKFNIINNISYKVHSLPFGNQCKISLFENIAICSLFKKKIKIKIINNKMIIPLIYFFNDPTYAYHIHFVFFNIFKYCDNIYLKYKSCIMTFNKPAKYFYSYYDFFTLGNMFSFGCDRYVIYYNVGEYDNISNTIILYFKNNIKYSSIKSIKSYNLSYNQIIKLNKKNILISKHIQGTLIFINLFSTINKLKKILKKSKNIYKLEKNYFYETHYYKIILKFYKNKKIINMRYFNAQCMY